MSEQVLVVPAKRFYDLGGFDGFSPEWQRYQEVLLDPNYLQFRPRDQAEYDPSFKQLIPYLVLCYDGRLFHYRRVGGSEKRLSARRSIGLGGHINPCDAQLGSDIYRAGMLRELAEEAELPTYQETIIGIINDDRTLVGRVHLGIVHLLMLSEPRVQLREPSLAAGGFASVDELRPHANDFESWSLFLLEAWP
ncbi:MAG: phosphoesterase, partial [Gemmataceae bacterium]